MFTHLSHKTCRYFTNFYTFYMFYTAKNFHENLCASETLCLCAKNSSLLVNRIK